MSLYRKLILVVGSLLVCAVGAIFSLVSGLVVLPGGSAEHDADANALRNVGHLIETQGMISSYSIAAWTDSLDMTLDTALDTSHAAIIAYQVCSESKSSTAPPMDRSALFGQWSQSGRMRNRPLGVGRNRRKPKPSFCFLSGRRPCFLCRSCLLIANDPSPRFTSSCAAVSEHIPSRRSNPRVRGVQLLHCG